MNFLDNQKVRTEKLYTVGYNPIIGEYVMSVVITWVIWFHRYYKITKDEYNLAETNPEALDAIAKQFLKEESKSERFLCSDGPKENNEAQDELLKKLKSYKANDEFVRF